MTAATWFSRGLLVLVSTASFAMAEAPDRAPCAAAQPETTVSGFRVIAADDDPDLEPQTLLIAYSGVIAFPFAGSLRDIWSERREGVATVVLDLSSPGGEIGEVEDAIAVIDEIRRSARLVTRVGQGRQCLSACVLLFAQGEERIAGNASVWMFHAPCQLHTNMPEAASVDRFLGLLASAGIAPAFAAFLMSDGHLTDPGRFWMSGHEVYRLAGANLITALLDAWEPEAPRQDLDPQIRPR